MIVYLAPCNFKTPVIFNLCVLIPSIFAPKEFRKLATSVTSGSNAAFSIIVVPLAKTDANKILIVAPTEGKSRGIKFPNNFFVFYNVPFFVSFIFTLSNLKPVL